MTGACRKEEKKNVSIAKSVREQEDKLSLEYALLKALWPDYTYKFAALIEHQAESGVQTGSGTEI